MSDHPYHVVEIDGITQVILTPKTLGLSSLWKYSNLWYRTFHYEGGAFSILAEQKDIGDCFVHGPSAQLTDLLKQKGVKGPKDYHVDKVEGDPEVEGQYFHLKEKFTLEVKKEGDTYRYKVYPAEYNGMVQKRCLMRASFPAPPRVVTDRKFDIVFSGPKASIPNTYQHLLKPKQSSLGCLPFMISLMTILSILASQMS